MQLKTLSGWSLSVAISAMQKEVRRANLLYAGYWANEVYCSGYYNYVWKRFIVISAEDCAGCITQEIWALNQVFKEFVKKRDDIEKGHLFMLKALVLLCQSYKNRDSDHLLCFVAPDAPCVDLEELKSQVEEIENMELPDYALDCHTAEGRAMGRGAKEFNLWENEALTPKIESELDVLPQKFEETKQRYRQNVYNNNNRLVMRDARKQMLSEQGRPSCPKAIVDSYKKKSEPTNSPVRKRTRTRKRS